MARTYTREDVTRSYHNGSQGLPMVNVKVYGSIDARTWEAFRADENPDPRFTPEWLEENVNEEGLESYWQFACESESEYYVDWIKETFGRHVVAYHEGRSGGWIVVSGLRPVDEWDAVTLAKWRKMERIGREIADGIPSQMLSLIYINAFHAWSDERLEDEPAMDAPEALAALR